MWWLSLSSPSDLRLRGPVRFNKFIDGIVDEGHRAAILGCKCAETSGIADEAAFTRLSADKERRFAGSATIDG